MASNSSMSRTALMRQRLSQKISDKISSTLSSTLMSSAQAASQTAQLAAQSARQRLDRVLLGLNHTGLTNIQNSDDLIQKVGRGVLERAEAIRQQIAKTPLSPGWLKDVSFAQKNGKNATGANANTNVSGEPALSAQDLQDLSVPSELSASLDEASVSAPAEGMQPESFVEAEAKASTQSQAKTAAAATDGVSGKRARTRKAKGRTAQASASPKAGKSRKKTARAKTARKGSEAAPRRAKSATTQASRRSSTSGKEKSKE